MAKTTIQIDVNTGGSVKSLSDLRGEFKDIQKELSGLTPGTEKYIDALKRLGAVKDEIGDLKDEINAFAGADKKIAAVSNVIGGVASGFAAAQGAAALFGSESEDLQKTLVKVQSAMAFAEGIKGIAAMGDSFKVLGNVIKANPIMLIGTILIGIGTALFALRDKIAIVGKAFDFFGGVIDNVIDSVKTFTDWIGISSFKADEANEKLIKNAEKAKEAITERYDAEIRAAKRAGKETEDLEISKTRNLYLQNYEQIKALRDLGSRKSEEQTNQLAELEKQNKEYYQILLDLEDEKNDKLEEKQKEADKKADENRKLKAQKDLEAAEKWRKEQQGFIDYELEALNNKYGEAEQIIAEQQLATKIALNTATPQEIEAWNAYNLQKQQEYNNAVDAELKRLKAIEDKRIADEDAKKADEYALRLES
jgi:3-methyladenine DNA glycosylase AlkC